MKIKEYMLTTNEAKAVKSIVLEIEKKQENRLSWVLNNAKVIADKLPCGVKKFIYDFKVNDKELGVCIKGNLVDDTSIGNTPSDFFTRDEKSICTNEEIMFILYSELLGFTFGWNSIQNGNIINDIFPMKKDCKSATSAGSAYDFGMHTEDAFHPYRADYLVLFGMRNPDEVATLISFLKPDDLSSETIESLFKKEFVVGANVGQNVTEIEEYTSALFGCKSSPYLKVNMNNMRSLNQKSKEALFKLNQALLNNTFKYRVQQGDFLVLDNLKTVHGREKYVPRYDGTDRWLKRMQVTNDIRKSRDIRRSASSRVLIANQMLEKEAAFIK
ncbi:TauD/TfdA family dioxygenase [Alteromonas sp. a30]|uniref:TauD/TfdA family dioxygenase n=1 Tax=Alteromonas sp. a30 TaxID=2730917 RepID=UPI00227FFFF3|nr:TauD/TfdA family dioxygenase [Alteromonas sp. a30]MCY7297541.1 hypothetical protein [Alteromonas sp. a30]